MEEGKIDFHAVVVQATRIVVLGGLLLVALAGCGKDKDSSTMRGRLRQISKKARPNVQAGRETTPTTPGRGPLR